MDDYNLSQESEDIEVVYLDDEIDELFDDVEDVEDISLNQKNVKVQDLSTFTFNNHIKSIFCCDLSKDGYFAATGGEDDTAYLWSTSSGEVIFECTGHKDSVTSVFFNHNDQLLVTGDMSGLLQVWDIKEKKLIWCYEGDDMEWLTWHFFTNVLVSGSHSGDIYIWQIPQGNCKLLGSHGSSSTCGKILPDGKRLLAGYDNGQIKLWDMKTTTVIWNFLNSKQEGITSLEINSEGILLSVAPSSELIKMSDGKSIETLLAEGESEIEAHIFSSEFNFLITGSLSGQIFVWDLSKQIIRYQANVGSGVTILKLGSNGKVFIGSTDGNIYVCDIRTGTLIKTLSGHKADVLSLCVFPDGSSILTTSDDKTAKIFKNTL